MGEEAAVGFCDGIKGNEIFGWAWWPASPDRPVTIELLLDDRPTATAVANQYRADLRAAGIGHGRYGFRFPLPRLGATERVRIEVRIQDDATLKDGVFDYSEAPMAAAGEANAFSAFIDSVLAAGDVASPAAAAPARPRTRLLVYSAGPIDNRVLGAPEYSYGFVAKAFVPLLATLGEVVPVDGSAEAIDRQVDAGLAAGEATILLSFAPPHRTPLGLRCPTIPVVAWEYPTIPMRSWDGEPRNDWSFVLRQTGRAITLCHEATAAFRAAMGEGYPVMTVPTPVWDRLPGLHALGAPEPGVTIVIDGFVLDTREHDFPVLDAIPSAPVMEGGGANHLPRAFQADGVVFTTVLAPKDGRKNWRDIVSAFIAAHRDNADATLVVKMIGADPGIWWYEFHEMIGRQAAFACRVVILQGYLDDAGYRDLVRATHWVVNASRCEGQCLPLLEFMSGGRPAIAPDHTAMKDYISPANAILVAASEEYCAFPHDPANELTTIRHRIDWVSLREAFADGYRVSTGDPGRYAALAQAARATIRDYCRDEVVGATLGGFLGLGARDHAAAPVPARLLQGETA